MSYLNDKLAAEDRTLFISRMRIALLYMAVPLVLSFAIVDYFLSREKFSEFFILRLTVVPIAFTLLALYRAKWISHKHYHIPAYLFLSYLSILNTYLAWSTGGVQSPYYAGLNLVGIAAFGFLPWTARDMFIAAIALYGPWFMCAWQTGPAIDMRWFAPHTAFMLSTMFMASITTYISYGLRRSSISLQLELEQQVLTRQEIITQKTNEGVYLERLTNQFCPQVVEAIKDGRITVDTRVRRQITCIFVDIENSTGRSNRVDYESYTSVLSDFFSKCTEVFLQHNVTVGTYLGDGIMAFVNAPDLMENHGKVALDSSLSILRIHRKLRRNYKERWRTDFNVRIGIHTGYASVGFFPSYERGTYTAIGEAVNLTARLCSKALPNSICVTKSFVKECAMDIQPEAAVFAMDPSITIKGYEGDNIELYSLNPIHNEEAEALTHEAQTCPVCENPLKIKADLGGSTLLACSQCDFTDVIAKKLDMTPDFPSLN